MTFVFFVCLLQTPKRGIQKRRILFKDKPLKIIRARSEITDLFLVWANIEKYSYCDTIPLSSRVRYAAAQTFYCCQKMSYIIGSIHTRHFGLFNLGPHPQTPHPDPPMGGGRMLKM